MVRINDYLHEYLKTQFTDLEGAKQYMQRFYDGGQSFKGMVTSLRFMSGAVSRVLEGKPPSTESSFLTKYGPELYDSVDQRVP